MEAAPTPASTRPASSPSSSAIGAFAEGAAPRKAPKRQKKAQQNEKPRTPEEDSFRKGNNRNRTSAWKFLSGRLLLYLCIIRLVIELSMVYLRKQHYLGQHSWFHEQLAKGLSQPCDQKEGDGSMDFRILLSARGGLDVAYTHTRHVQELCDHWNFTLRVCSVRRFPSSFERGRK